jgi:hypothetical protein
LGKQENGPVRAGDVEILRRLAAKQAQIAQSPENAERRRLWIRHNDLQGERPMVLIEARIAFDELFDDKNLECTEQWARDLERQLRSTIWRFETVRDDFVVEPYVSCQWKLNVSDYGVRIERTTGQAEGGLMGSYVWDAPIKNIHKDFHKLRPRTYSVDRESTLAWKAHLESVLAGLLEVRIRGGFWWSLGMTSTAIGLIGLENLMLFMYDDPQGLHRLMSFLLDDHMNFATWVEAEGLLGLNNQNDYIGSGTLGYTRCLPAEDYAPGSPARLKDQWVLLESQETVGVGPRQFEEFVFPYQSSLAEKFGLVYYGCCEPVHSRWQVIKKLPNLRSVSVSPWCDQEFMAAELGRRYVFSRKPNPTLISTRRFDEDLIRQDLRRTLDLADGCELEIIMKDVHTLSGEPTRVARWVELAREAIAERA